MMVCCLLIGGGLDMAVICHAQSGHAAIEAAADSNCVKSPSGHCDEASPPSAENGFSSTDDCGDCLDVPLYIGPAVAAKKPYRANIAPATWTAVGLATDSAADSSQSLSLPELDPSPPYFTPLESLILLI